jgi:hypothetical protein
VVLIASTKRLGATFFLGKKGGYAMFLLLALILVLCWGGGFFLFHISAFFIHILLILAVISLIGHFLTGRNSTV